MVNKRVAEFTATKCPKDCPFLQRMAGGQSVRFCAFSLFADMLEPGRHTRTDIDEDGNVNYHIPPDCDVYERYRGKKAEIKRAERKYEAGRIRAGRYSKFKTELAVTGHKHPMK